MLSRSVPASAADRASAMRRQRRRTAATRRAYCATNGCASFLELDAVAGVEHCPVCGYSRRAR